MRNAAALLLCLLGCGPSTPTGTTPTPTPPAAAGQVTSQGGLVGDSEGANLWVPAGAVDAPTSVELTVVPNAPFESRTQRLLSAVYRVRANGQDHVVFKKPVMVRLPFDPAKLAHPKHRAAVGISVRGTGGWSRIPASYGTPEDATAAAETDHFSDVAVTEDLPDSPDGEGRVTARWSAWLHYRRHNNYSSEPGGFGEDLGGPVQDIRTTVSLAWREQINLEHGTPETVVEPAVWASSVRNGFFRLKSGDKLPGGPGGSGSGTIPNAQFNADVKDTTLTLRVHFSKDEAAFDVVTTPPKLEDPRKMTFVTGPPKTARIEPPLYGRPMDLVGRADRDGNLWFRGSGSKTWDDLSERLGGGGNLSWEAVAVRIATPQTMRLKGRAIHRIHTAGKGDGFIAAPSAETSSWAELADLVIPANVRLELEMNDSGPIAISTDDAGAFDITLPYKEDAVLRLKTTFANGEAQVREECKAEMRLGMLAGRDKVDIFRTYTSWLRYAGAETEFPLGAEERPVFVTQTAQGPVVEFKELGSLLVNTFIYQARHVNQNIAGFSIKNAWVPRKKIEEQAPRSWLSEQAVQTALARIPQNDRVDVEVKGWEICFPSSTLMVLDALGARTATEPGIGELAQSVYDLHSREGEAVRVLPEPYRWWVPFDGDDGALDRFLEAFDAPDMGAAAAEAAIEPYTKHWPYVDGVKEDREWLLTVVNAQSGATWRPWQIADFMFNTVRAHHGNQVVPEAVYEVDVFQPAGRDRVVQTLSKGAVGTISIAHKGYYQSGGTYRGTHVLALLGVVQKTDGTFARVIFHDPWGDQTQNPTENGYIDARRTPALSDIDKTGHKGAYVPYGMGDKPIKSYQDKIVSAYIAVYRPAAAPASSVLRERLLPGD